MAEWEKIIPKVNESAEFLEIASDFGNPLELFREALHSAYDWGATEFKVLLQALDRDVPELLCSGHPFPKENYNINKLFDTYGEIAADYYVKKYVC